MSIEYTIDIQLTELGFSDILEPRETSVTETPRLSTSSDDSLLPSHSHTSLPKTHKERLLVRGQKSAAAKEAGAAKKKSFNEKNTQVCASSLTEELPCKPADPSQTNKQTVKDSATLQPSDSTETDAGQHNTDSLLLITQQGGAEEEGDRKKARDTSAEAQQDVDSDSDDSDVSMLDEDEEVDEEDEEDEEEEGPNSGMTRLD